MKKSLYICNANNSNSRVYPIQDYDRIGVSSVSRIALLYGLFAKLKRRVRSLFVHTAKLVRQMRTIDKQALKAKNSNLYARKIDFLIAFGTLIISTLLLLYAPDILMYIAKFLGCVALVAMAVVPMLYALTYEPYERN